MTLIPKSQNAPYPPGNGYSYTEPKTGRVFDGMLGNVETTARSVIAFKLANPHLFPEGGGDLASTVQLIYAQKWESMPWLFIGGGDAPGTASSQLNVIVCVCGETDWKPVYCKTCGPGRIKAYVCAKCGKTR